MVCSSNPLDRERKFNAHKTFRSHSLTSLAVLWFNLRYVCKGALFSYSVHVWHYSSKIKSHILYNLTQRIFWNYSSSTLQLYQFFSLYLVPLSIVSYQNYWSWELHIHLARRKMFLIPRIEEKTFWNYRFWDK